MGEWIILVISYLLGSIPFGFLIARYSSKMDIRTKGSGNIGSTNVLRVLGKKAALITLIGDMLKGVIPVMVVKFTTENLILLYLTGIMAVIGHMFPIWLKFKGGKGVATGSAILLCISPKIGIMTCLTWLLVFALSRISSLAAIIAIALSPIYAYWFCGLQPDLPLFCFALAVLILCKHTANIKRLLKGEEKKI
ncbi:glycerol-3-phosphate 1-O-acyltransferase PlsY [Rickettsiales endosymbiont of Stachyamoeba lipophora]|uniref:glycerol-3-phosphate 1-O-acyltransferase PlsY n=1 Tax=Rickettsiales endosymbiont of Stachyamoeba lipophora TaxID=2486578 RepID=UPI000F648CEA|nr:glycerol-3-phosphate 1-O-acyltransferase PlsY [Rickettsiales endosymbiont of Stachyamoeba lipophora]AZL16055.1 glycerol-3-phosphate 1-O-acyltransferase [Rickettsiales endosymbiont of Stachyamoeba lipophora]